jgi:hypothetical protein
VGDLIFFFQELAHTTSICGLSEASVDRSVKPRWSRSEKTTCRWTNGELAAEMPRPGAGVEEVRLANWAYLAPRDGPKPPHYTVVRQAGQNLLASPRSDIGFWLLATAEG